MDIEPVMIFSREMIARLQLLRRVLHLVQHAVDAEADAEALFQRLEVNVATRACCAPRRSIIETILMIGASPMSPSAPAAAALAGDLDVARRASMLIARPLRPCRSISDRPSSMAVRRGADELQIALEQVVQRIERVEIQRVADGDHQPGLGLRDGHDLEALGDIRRAPSG